MHTVIELCDRLCPVAILAQVRSRCSFSCLNFLIRKVGAVYLLEPKVSIADCLLEHHSKQKRICQLFQIQCNCNCLFSKIYYALQKVNHCFFQIPFPIIKFWEINGTSSTCGAVAAGGTLFSPA
jgi:hypothetical protein